MLLFAIATIVPVILIGLAALWGGALAWAAVCYLTVFVALLDRLTAGAGNADPETEFPASRPLLVVLAALHFALLGAAVWAVGGQSGLSTLDRVLVAVAAGLFFGQVSHPVAHELIHKPARQMRLLGRLIYSSLLIGHHASAHLMVHHIHVGSDADPNSARRGEGFYRFALRASRESFLAGFAAENRRRKVSGAPLLKHPYVLYAGAALANLGLALLLAGPAGALALIAMALYAQLQILLSDYVQHYGLQRHILADGRLEPVGPQHSWNAPQLMSSAVMLNAPRHSDHHVTPSRPFPALQLDAERMPCLPHSMPVMAVLALVPPVWKRVMNPACDRWRPEWTARPDVRARDIPQAVLARAKSGGLFAPHLAKSDHADDMPLAQHAHDRARGPRSGDDERRRV